MKSILLILSLGILAYSATAQNTKNFIDQPYVEVVGLGDTLITPNEIFVDVIISESDTKDRKSIEDLEKRLLASLKSIGIDADKDLTVKQFDSKFEWQSFKTKVIKTKTYQIKISNGLMLGKLFNALEGDRIANAMVTKLGHTEMSKIQMNCRIKAMRQAKANATALVAPLGQSLGAAIYINNVSSAFEKKMGTQRQSNDYAKKMEYKPRQSEISEGIELEQLKIEEMVEVKFILK